MAVSGRPARESTCRSARPHSPAAWLSPRDANQLLLLAITQNTRGHPVVHGVSNNAAKQLSLHATSAALGYAPVDDAFA